MVIPEGHVGPPKAMVTAGPGGPNVPQQPYRDGGSSRQLLWVASKNINFLRLKFNLVLVKIFMTI